MRKEGLKLNILQNDDHCGDLGTFYEFVLESCVIHLHTFTYRETEVVLDLVMSGALAHIDNIHIDWSGFASLFAASIICIISMLIGVGNIDI